MKTQKYFILLVLFFILNTFIFISPNIIIDRALQNNPQVSDYLPNLPVNYDWNKTIDGSNSDHGYDLVIDSSYNFYMVCRTNSYGAGGLDFYVMKYNVTGDHIWSTTWGTSLDEDDPSLVMDRFDNLYVSGRVYRPGVTINMNMTLVKLDSEGNQLWNIIWDSIGSGHDYCYGLAVDIDCNVYVIVNTLYSYNTTSYISLLKFNSAGTFQWQKNWGKSHLQSYRTTSYGISIDSHNNIFVTGTRGFTSVYPESDSDIFLVKFNSTGHEIWNRTYGGDKWDTGFDIIFDELENIYITGECASQSKGKLDLIILKCNSLGFQIKNSTWGGESFDIGMAAEIDTNNNLYVGGYSNSWKGTPYHDQILLKFDLNLNLVWNDSWGYDNYYDNVRDLKIDRSNNVYLLGSSNFGSSYDITLVKFSNSLPILLVDSPIQNETFGSRAPDFNLRIIEPDLNETWYSLNSDPTNYSFSGNSFTIDQDAWDSYDNMSLISVHIFANDTFGNIGSVSVEIYKTIYLPLIGINSPHNYDIFGFDAPSFNISVSGEEINKTWYTIDGGTTNYTITELTGTINQSAWDSKGTELITLTFYANDSLGRIGSKDVIIWKDVTKPLITIDSPLKYQLCGIAAPSFSITIDELNLQEKRYSLNGRPNITFTTETQFRQTEWNQVGNGTVSIIFYAIDKVGNTNSSEVIVRKDAYVPDITIYSPLDDQKFGKTSPDYNITIIEEDLASTWYTIEGVAGTFSFTGLTGIIDQDAWDDAPEGEITITFYAIDGAGNLGSENVVVIKSIPSKPEISGFNLFLLLGILAVASILISKKLKRS